MFNSGRESIRLSGSERYSESEVAEFLGIPCERLQSWRVANREDGPRFSVRASDDSAVYLGCDVNAWLDDLRSRRESKIAATATATTSENDDRPLSVRYREIHERIHGRVKRRRILS